MSTPPFSTRRLDAERCALSYVASIMIVLSSALAAAKPGTMRAKTPWSLQWFQLLYRVLAEPHFLSASHHRESLRLMKIMPLKTHRLSKRHLPWLWGGNGGGP